MFLSHSIHDADLVLGVKQILEDHGLSVYVDWVEDAQLDRERVDNETASLLRTRMCSCQSLMYLHSDNSRESKWMPWELGFFDGHNGNAAILPVVDHSWESFVGQEYLGIYPYVEVSDGTVRIHRSAHDRAGYQVWTRRNRLERLAG